MAKIPLREMKKETTGRIVQIKGAGQIGLRIREMGLVPGTIVTVVDRAPLYDPVHLKLGNNSLTLRSNEADFIIVEVSEEQSE